MRKYHRIMWLLSHFTAYLHVFMKRHLLFLSIGHPRAMEGCAAEFFSHLVVAVEIGHGMSDVASA